jgi:hypothetical protein
LGGGDGSKAASSIIASVVTIATTTTVTITSSRPNDSPSAPNHWAHRQAPTDRCQLTMGRVPSGGGTASGERAPCSSSSNRLRNLRKPAVSPLETGNRPERLTETASYRPTTSQHAEIACTWPPLPSPPSKAHPLAGKLVAVARIPEGVEMRPVANLDA